MKNNVVVIVLALALAVACYLLGWSNVSRRESSAREARGRLGINLAIYQEMEHGDFQRAKVGLGMLILGQTRIYEQQYGVPASTDSFAHQFGEAQFIASQVESNLVPLSSVFTNIPHKPDMKITDQKQQ